MNDTLAIVVMSCDNYADVWQPFYLMFKKHWADCCFPVYFVSEEKVGEFPEFIPLTYPKGMAWSEMLYQTVAQTNSTYLLLLQEDFLLSKGVQNSRLQEAIEMMAKHEVGMLRLFPCPKPDRPFLDYDFIGEIDEQAEFRVSCQASIWEKETLLKIIDRTETIQDFEIKGTLRSKQMEKRFLSYLRFNQISEELIPRYQGNIVHYVCTAVVKGKWTQEAVQFCKKEGIAIDFTKRKAETNFDIWRKKFHARTPKPFQSLVWRLLHNRFLKP
jgi:hypothetical protein